MSFKNLKPLAGVATAGLLMGFGPQAMAANTAAGTTVSGIATVTFSSAGQNNQTTESAPSSTDAAGTSTSFVVDRKVLHSVVRNSEEFVTADNGSTAKVIQFTVTNTGNSSVDYLFSTEQPTNDGFNVENVQVFVESGATAGYQAAEDTATFIVAQSADATDDANARVVYVVADMPAADQSNDAIADVYLIATAAEGGVADNALTPGDESQAPTALFAADDGSAADDLDAVQNVYVDAGNTSVTGDSDRDGNASALGSYKATASAVLTVLKTSIVISDPVNGTSNAKRIPGAVVQWTLVISNAANSAPATGVTISDTIDATVTEYNAGSAKIAVNSGEATTLDNVDTTDAATLGFTITDAINGGDTVTITYTVTIQ